MKVSEEVVSFEFLVGFFSYVCGFIVWFIILRLYPLSLSFPVASGLLIISTQLVGIYILKENYNIFHLIGIACIFIGISILFSNYNHGVKL
jgi:drug/metabolite transporter (DMT)-like permease